MKKILFLSSDTGGGHRASAKAIIEAVARLSSEKDIKCDLVDVFAECSNFLNIFARLYAPVIKYTPSMWGRMYYFMNDWKKLESLEKISRPFIRKELGALIKKRKPDIVVSVHPMVNHLAVQALKDLGLEIPMITVVTDPIDVHRAWISPDVDWLVVASEDAKKIAVGHGMPKEKIKVIGLPIHPKFLKKEKDTKALRIKMKLKPDLFTVLLMGGGEGVGGIDAIVKALAKSGLDIQLIVIAGRNKVLQNKLDKLSLASSALIRVFGFVENVPEIMSASDLIVTKAGPGTIAEALAMDLPLLITSWLPGQEEGNVRHVVKEGVGAVAKKPKEVVDAISRLLKTDGYKEMKLRIEKVKRPRAVFEIAELILSSLKYNACLPAGREGK